MLVSEVTANVTMLLPMIVPCFAAMLVPPLSGDMSILDSLRERFLARSERLKEIQALAAKGGTPSADALQKLAFLQAALVAVREEIDAHSVSIGGGSDEPLA